MGEGTVGTNLKIAAVVLGTIGLYTLVANSIPQVESAVPEQLTVGADMTPEQLAAAGQTVFDGAGGCTACHGLGTRAPNLRSDHAGEGTVGARCATRVDGMDCKEYLHASLVDPNAFVVEGFQPIMPNVARTLSETQVWALVAYLESLGGEITVTPDDIPEESGSGTGSAGAAAGAGGSAQGETGPLEPLAIMEANQCLACHVVNGQGGPIGPALDGIGARVDAEYIRRSILEPNADTAQGYEAVAGTMPATLADQLSDAQIEVLVWYLASQK